MDTENELCDPICFLSNGKRKFMRIFITYENDRLSMDIPLGATVGKIKASIIKKLSIPQNHIQLGNENQMRKVLILNFAGAELPDHWILSDLSIPSGSTLKAYMKGEMDPILYFKIGYNQKLIPVLDKLKLQDLSVSDVRSLASSKSGLPCSVFRMINEQGKDMFDCYMVEDYDIRTNSIIRIETWDGWNELLQLSSQGFTKHVLEKLNNEDEILCRYQMKVAMFMAAHFGHVDLAVTMCKHGIKPGEPVGLHPLRQWCPKNQHIDTLKAPIHEAVECGQIGVLRCFVHHSITSILSKDGHGLQPLNIALRKKIKNCASFLLSKQWSRIPFNGNTITLSVYSKLKIWTEKAKERASLKYNLEKHSKRKIIRSFPLVGQGIYIDGFSSDQISSRSKFPHKKQYKTANIESYYQKLYGVNPEQYFKNPDSSSKILQSRNFSQSSYRKAIRTSSMADSDHESHSGTPDQFAKEKQFKLPKINSKPNELSRSQSSSTQSNENISQEINKKSTKKNSKKKKTKNSIQEELELSKNKGDSNLPLPLKSFDCTPRPYYHVGHHQIDDIAQSIETFYKDIGCLPRTYAIKNLNLTNQLKDKTWLTRVSIAMKLGKENVKKSVNFHSNSVLSN